MNIKPTRIILYALSNVLYVIIFVFLVCAPFISEEDAQHMSPILLPLFFFFALYRAVVLLLLQRKTDFKRQLSASGHKLLAFTFPDKTYAYQVTTLLCVGIGGLVYWLLFSMTR